MSYNFDPELAPIAALFPPMPPRPLAEVRAGLEAMVAERNAAVDLSGLTLRDCTVAGTAGAPPVRLRLYLPKQPAGGRAGLLYIHGGGFMVGSIDTEHANAAQLADRLGIVVASVEYRLAPEHPFPAGLDDCYAALGWLHANAAELEVDRARIAVFGQSAGGGLAAAVALLARDCGGPALCFQFLGIPELDDRLQTASMRAFTDTPMWNRPSAIASWDAYLGERYRAGAADVPVYAAPARATDLRGLPPAYISAMEFDPLRDEAVLYGLKLLEAGVPVELHTFPGTFHGSTFAAQAAVTQRQEREMLDVLQRALRRNSESLTK
jgi:acetyl esterase